LAHPYLTGLAEDEVAALLLDLKSAGLRGVEVYYPEHPPRCVTAYLALAAEHDLLVTGGTDFHGDIKPEIQMGTGLGDLHVPFEVYDGLRKATA
jgi:predicted metal-dependent phosphoesterase TrpH